jgi:translocon-associated protein subunit beta
MNSLKLVFLLVSVLLVQFSVTNGDATAAAPAAEELEDARLLIAKNVLNNYLVEGSDLEVRYNIYNIGNLPATSVKLVDENFPAERFEYVSGFNTVRWPKVLPHSNVSHVAVVRPRFVGALNLTHATVTYLPNEKSQRVQVNFFIEINY